MDYVKSQSENAVAVQEEILELRQRMTNVQNELNSTMGENERLSEELSRQQTLYSELKKMRGRGEEMDMLQQLEQVYLLEVVCLASSLNCITVSLGISRGSTTYC